MSGKRRQKCAELAAVVLVFFASVGILLKMEWWMSLLLGREVDFNPVVGALLWIVGIMSAKGVCCNEYRLWRKIGRLGLFKETVMTTLTFMLLWVVALIFARANWDTQSAWIFDGCFEWLLFFWVSFVVARGALFLYEAMTSTTGGFEEMTKQKREKAEARSYEIRQKATDWFRKSRRKVFWWCFYIGTAVIVVFAANNELISLLLGHEVRVDWQTQTRLSIATFAWFMGEWIALRVCAAERLQLCKIGNMQLFKEPVVLTAVLIMLWVYLLSGVRASLDKPSAWWLIGSLWWMTVFLISFVATWLLWAGTKERQ